MKQIIIMAATIALGIALFNIIAGGNEDSILSVIQSVWEQEIEMRTCFP